MLCDKEGSTDHNPWREHIALWSTVCGSRSREWSLDSSMRWYLRKLPGWRGSWFVWSMRLVWCVRGLRMMKGLWRGISMKKMSGRLMKWALFIFNVFLFLQSYLSRLHYISQCFVCFFCVLFLIWTIIVIIQELMHSITCFRMWVRNQEKTRQIYFFCLVLFFLVYAYIT